MSHLELDAAVRAQVCGAPQLFGLDGPAVEPARVCTLGEGCTLAPGGLRIFWTSAVQVATRREELIRCGIFWVSFRVNVFVRWTVEASKAISA